MLYHCQKRLFQALKTSLMAEMNSRFEKVGDQLTNIPVIEN